MKFCRKEKFNYGAECMGRIGPDTVKMLEIESNRGVGVAMM